MDRVLHFRRRHFSSYAACALLVLGLDLATTTHAFARFALIIADAGLVMYLFYSRPRPRAHRALVNALKKAELLFFGQDPLTLNLNLGDAAPYFSDAELNHQVATFIENVVGFSKRPLSTQISPGNIKVTAGSPVDAL